MAETRPAPKTPDTTPLANLTRATLREGRYAYIDFDRLAGIYPVDVGMSSSKILTMGGHEIEVVGSPDEVYKLLLDASMPRVAPKAGH